MSVVTSEGYANLRQRKNPATQTKRSVFRCMRSSTKDKFEGTAKETVGKIKEETGKAIGNPNLEERGADEKLAGKVERKIGDVKKVFEK